VIAPLGAVLAGGAARRMGGAKMTASYAGRPLIAWPVDALRSVLDDVVVVAKRDTALPPLPVPVWIEPDEPRHPLAGIVHALREAGQRAVLVCAGDMPSVNPAVVRALVAAPSAATVVPRAGGRLQPLLARYEPAALDRLAAAAASSAPLTEVVESLGPRVLEIADAASFRNVNTAEEL
jgi:molybdopterin-guanine dinucleotide biosynthesis protein A